VPRRSHSEQAIKDVRDIEDKKLKMLGWKAPKVALQAMKDGAKSFAKNED
jgi:inorganic pyrophosphatase